MDKVTIRPSCLVAQLNGRHRSEFHSSPLDAELVLLAAGAARCFVGLDPDRTAWHLRQA